jgi:hypothetical protein
MKFYHLLLPFPSFLPHTHLMDSFGPGVSGVHSGPADSLEEFHHLLLPFPSFLPPTHLMDSSGPDVSSVADAGCLSRIKKQQQKRGVKKNLLSYLFCSHKNHKIENYINFELVKKKLWANLQRIIELSTQKLSLSSQKYGFGIRDPEKTNSESRIQGSKRHRIPDPQHGRRWRASCHRWLSHGIPSSFTSLPHLPTPHPPDGLLRA